MRVLVSLAAAALFALTTAAAAAGPAARGRAIAMQKCARCHAIGATGASHNPKSPPFRTLSQRYPLDELEEALGEGIMVGHEGPEMPQFRFKPAEIGSLMAYLRSIQSKR